MKPLMQFIIAALIIPVLFSPQKCFAQQDNVWSLQRAVEYALSHNLTIEQNELNRRLSKLTLQQSRLSQLPNVNASAGYGRSFGRSVDPTTNQFVEGSSYDFMSLSANADVLVFGWFQKRNRIAQNRLNLAAADQDLLQIKNDISLNVATGYLRALLAKEQVRINEQQVALSSEQLGQTRSFAEAGRVPELNVAQLEAQLANDSANLITALTDYNTAILDIKAILNLDFDTPFEVAIPDVDVATDMSNVLHSPDEIYLAAAKNLGIIYSNELRLQAARKGQAAAFGSLFPQLAISAQAGSNYSTTFKDYSVTGVQVNPVPGSFAVDTVNRGVYQLYQSTPTFTTSITPLGKQLDNNFRQTVTIGLNIPIFNGWSSQTALKQAKINVLQQQNAKDQAEVKLRQDVYRAHNDVRNSLQKYNAALRAAESTKRAYEFAKTRNELGLTNTVEYLVIQNNWSRAEAQLASAKYDLIFKMKVIDYYLGKELKL